MMLPSFMPAIERSGRPSRRLFLAFCSIAASPASLAVSAPYRKWGVGDGGVARGNVGKRSPLRRCREHPVWNQRPQPWSWPPPLTVWRGSKVPPR